MEKIAQKNCVDFVDVLASKAAVPGGGGAAAAYPGGVPAHYGRQGIFGERLPGGRRARQVPGQQDPEQGPPQDRLCRPLSHGISAARQLIQYTSLRKEHRHHDLYD